MTTLSQRSLRIKSAARAILDSLLVNRLNAAEQRSLREIAHSGRSPSAVDWSMVEAALRRTEGGA